MNSPYTAPGPLVADQAIVGSKSAVSWAAIFAGTAVAIAVSLVLFTLGSGLGVTSLTPSARGAASPGGWAAIAAVWIVVVQWLSAATGGYLTGRLRTRWIGTHAHEVFFRDTAHGFITWAVATAIMAMLVASATSWMLAGGIHTATTEATGTAQGAVSNAQIGSVAPYDIDALFRIAPATADASSTDSATPTKDVQGEATRIFSNGLSAGSVPDADRTYLASLIVARTGISQADAEKRVEDVTVRIKEAEAKALENAEAARKAAAATSLLTALAMMIGAFIACVAAALGGHERDLHA